MNGLTSQQIECFHRDGVVIIPNVFSKDEIISIQNSFHAELLHFGVVSCWNIM